MTGSKNTGSTTRKSPAAKSKMSGLGVIGELDRYYYGEGRHYKINELKSPVTVIPPNISGLFICGYHIKLQYIVPIIAVIIIWAVAASASSMKFKEESFEHYSMYRAVKEQYQHLVEITYVKSKPDAE